MEESEAMARNNMRGFRRPRKSHCATVVVSFIGWGTHCQSYSLLMVNLLVLCDPCLHPCVTGLTPSPQEPQWEDCFSQKLLVTAICQNLMAVS